MKGATSQTTWERYCLKTARIWLLMLIGKRWLESVVDFSKYPALQLYSQSLNGGNFAAIWQI